MAVEDSVAQDQIRAFVERIERMEEEKKALSEDIKSIYAEAKGNGFDVKILRRVVGIRKQDANDRMEQEAILELYMSALGMVAAPPEYHEERDRLNSMASTVESSLRKSNKADKPDPIAALKADPALAIVAASEIKKPIPQPTKAAGSDLTTSQPLNGQVADIPETDIPVSNEAPSPAGEPGAVYWEVPSDDAERHQYSEAFGTMGQDIAVIEDDLARMSAQPVVKMGNVILDGWARHQLAKGMVGLDGKPVEYSVVQYDGRDELLDCIRWNLAGRILTEDQKRIICAKLVKLYPQRKGPIWGAFEFGMELV